ncbi:MAG: FtsW/RodA/SpoVE family cell cycle protein, partial [Candidatus Amulumruptor sp.]|nr:FtsW/RodA/SpoVE family cell cycle protein [Candidatus Amulumruptor sp.]
QKYYNYFTALNVNYFFSYLEMPNGGVFGVFPGNSRETARLPLAFSDYIYSIIIEDCGLVGGLVVLVLYLWLMARASGIAARCTRAFPAFLVLGMAVMIVIQALFHIAIVTGVFPVSGQPLPLISKGGSSILVTSIAFGVMLSVSRHTARTGKRDAERAEIESLPEDLRTANPTHL